MKTGINLSVGEECKAKNNVLDVGGFLTSTIDQGKERKKERECVFYFGFSFCGGGGRR